MKKWYKWSLGILLTFIILIIVVVATFWSSLIILIGTGELSGRRETIPEGVSLQQNKMLKGAADWICWRGANGNGRSEVSGIKKDWSGGLKRLWEVNFLCQGDGSAAWSAPVIQGDYLIACGRDTENDLIFCLDPVDGRLIWQEAYTAQSNTSHGAGPRATPYIDNERVYTFGRSGDLLCWNLLDGSQLWHKNVEDEGGEAPTWGHASSPLILDIHVLVQGGGTARTLAYDKMTGDVIWKSGNGLAGYAALTSLDFGGKSLIVAFHGKGLAALDAESGSELWNVGWETNYDVNATTPLVMGDSVFITSGYGTGCQLMRINHTEPQLLWRSETMASLHSDPHVIAGFLYGYSGDSYQNRGTFKCIDMKNGYEKWATNDMGWGTCVYVDDHLLCCDIEGNLFLMKPDPDKFIKVSELRNALGDIAGPVWTTPVIANGRMYLRFKQKLMCYDLKT